MAKDLLNDKAIRNAELGRHLMQVRDRAGIKQRELAKRVALSPAVLSRIESGERPVTLQEVQDALKADSALWQTCNAEWGKSTPGYKNRVAYITKLGLKMRLDINLKLN